MMRSSILAAISLALSTALQAAAGPDWLQDLAKKALPEGASGAPAWVLLDETNLVINDQGECIETHRVAVRLCANSGREYATGAVFYNGKSDKVEGNRAWLIRNGKVVENKSGSDWADIEDGSEGSVVDETRQRLISLREYAVAGDVFGFETQLKEPLPMAQMRSFIGSEIPVIDARITVTLPPGFSLTASTQEFRPLSAFTMPATNSWSWSLHDETYTPEEPCIADSAQQDAYILFRIIPPANKTKFAPRTFGSWAEVAHWVNELNASQCDSSPELAAKTRELTQDIPDTLGKIRAIAGYVQKLRYIAVNEGLRAGRGYQARKASLVFSRGFGDCKDKANLLRAMLHEAGITAYSVSALASASVDVVESCPSPCQFNHAITAIVVDDSIQLPTVVPTEKWGRLLFFDPTDPYSVIGDLPKGIQGTKAHLIAEGSDALVTLPTVPTRDGFAVQRKVQLTATPEGDVQVQAHIAAIGQAGRLLRYSIKKADMPKEMEALIARQLSDGFRGATITDKKISDDLVSGRSELSFDCTQKHYLQKLPGGLSVVKLDVLSRQMLPLFSENVRHRPIELPNFLFEDEVSLSIPAGQTIEEQPHPVAIQSPYGSYALSCSTEAGVLTLHRTITLNKVDVPVADYPKLKKFFTDLARADRSSVILKPKA